MDNIIGIDELLSKLKQLGNIDKNLFDSIGETIVDDAKQKCPVRSGNLRDSIVSEEIDNIKGQQLEISVKASYAAEVELGTSKMAARPFLLPAVEQNKAKIAEQISANVNKNIKGVIK